MHIFLLRSTGLKSVHNLSTSNSRTCKRYPLRGERLYAVAHSFIHIMHRFL
jgi:hypothetical protein